MNTETTDQQFGKPKNYEIVEFPPERAEKRCELCMYNNDADYCMAMACTPKDRMDRKFVYFVRTAPSHQHQKENENGKY